MKTHLKPWIIAGALSLSVSPIGYAQVAVSGQGISSAEVDENARFLGRVKYFNEGPGYGYIIPIPKPDGSRDIKVYLCDVRDHKALVAGELVEFSVRQNARGLEAIDVSKIGVAD